MSFKVTVENPADSGKTANTDYTVVIEKDGNVIATNTAGAFVSAAFVRDALTRHIYAG